MKSILISIIIATYNSENHLAYCLDSIVNQTYKNFEIIILDGKSTDKTVEIIEKYGKYINYWVSEKDSGIYDAWNKGISAAKGEWITFIGSDDAFYPDALENYVNYLTTLESYVEYISSKLHLTNKKRETIRILGRPWNWKTCRLQNVVAHPGSLHKSTLFEKYGTFDITYKISADFEFLLRPGKNLKSAFLNEVTVKMQQGGISTFNNNVYKEAFTAASTTGQVNIIIARFYFLYQNFKFSIKNILRKAGIQM